MNLHNYLLLLLPVAMVTAEDLGYCDDFVLELQGLEFEWQNPVGGENVAFIDDDIRWGYPKFRTGPPALTQRSGLNANDRDMQFPIDLHPSDDEFPLGEMRHMNYYIQPDGSITQVELAVTVKTNLGDYNFIYLLDVEETPNIEGSCEYQSDPYKHCADRIAIINHPMPQEVVTSDGIVFEIDLIGFRASAGAALMDEFISQEFGANSAYLYGTLDLVHCPHNGGGGGDPHFETFSGHWYEFHGGCDLRLLQAPHFAPHLPLTIDVRTKVREWYSYIESAAIQIGTEILEVSSFGEYQLNGVEDATLPTTLAGYRLTKRMGMKGDHVVDLNAHIFEIELGGDEKILIRTFKDMVTLKVENADKARFHGSSGMMGDFQTGVVYSRDGHHILEDAMDIANEWQVRGDEPMLFQVAQEPQYPAKCVMPKRTDSIARRLGRTVAEATARKACAHWTKDTREGCVQDVMKTGDLELAAAGTL